MAPDAATFALLQLCDSLFPIGAFSHSDGLEAATASGDILDADGLRAWMRACLDEVLARCEGPAVRLARDAAIRAQWSALAALDAELHAMRSSAAGRQASRAMGGRLLITWRRIRPSPLLDDLHAALGAQLTLPVSFGAVCAGSGIAGRAAVEGFIYTRLASTVSAAMRLMPLGQHEAHGLLAEMLADAPAAVDRIVKTDEGLSMFAPAMDIAAMSQQYVRSRLFRS
jgi:urease accessory protein